MATDEFITIDYLSHYGFVKNECSPISIQDYVNHTTIQHITVRFDLDGNMISALFMTNSGDINNISKVVEKIDGKMTIDAFTNIIKKYNFEL